MDLELESDKTKSAYLDKELVAGYAKVNVLHEEMLNHINSFLDSLTGKQIIDIGCGVGHMDAYMSSQGFEVTGIDASPTMIKYANEHYKPDSTRYLTADMKFFSRLFKPSSFDGAFLSASLLHIPKKEVNQVLEEAKRVLNPGAKLYISLKEGNGEHLLKEDAYGKSVERFFSYWQESDFRKVIEAAGLSIERVEKDSRRDTYWLHFYLSVPK
jgi:2-polyprenyl-3-methyl-5-hydroxy-6-metoxy-1,4-benzoquinol methylase